MFDVPPKLKLIGAVPDPNGLELPENPVLLKTEFVVVPEVGRLNILVVGAVCCAP